MVSCERFGGRDTDSQLFLTGYSKIPQVMGGTDHRPFGPDLIEPRKRN